MGISGTALNNLITASLNRYAVDGLTAAESAAISASVTSGDIYSFIQAQINSRLASAPTANATSAIFSTGQSISGNPNDVAAWKEANQIAANSGGTIYAINQTAVGQFINDPTSGLNSYLPSIYANLAQSMGVASLSTGAQEAIYQIINGAASYNFAVAAPAVSYVAYGTSANPNSVFYCVEIAAFAATQSTGTLNGVLASSLPAVNFSPANAQTLFNSTNPILVASNSVIDYNASALTDAVISGPNASTATSTVSGTGWVVTTSNDTVDVGTNTPVAVLGGTDVINAQKGATVTIGNTNATPANNAYDTVNAKTGGVSVKLNANAQANLVFSGTGNSVTNLGTNDTAYVSGSGVTVTTGAGDAVVLSNTTNNADTVNATGDSSSSGSNTWMTPGIYLSTGAKVNVNGNNDTITIQASNDTLTIGSSYTGNVVNIAPGVTGETITASGATINGNDGGTLKLTGSNDIINVGNPINVGNLNIAGTTSNNDVVVETNPDNSRQLITVNGAGPVYKDSVSYLSSGQKLSDVKANTSAGTGSGSFQTFSLNSTWKWSSSTFIFGSDGSAIRQETPNVDGSEFVTVYKIPVTWTSPSPGATYATLTYQFATIADANNAIATNNASAAIGSIAMYDNSTTPFDNGNGNALWYSANWQGSTSDSLSGAGSTQFYGGMVTKFNVSNLRPRAFLGSNTTAISEATSLVGNLANVVVDPLVINVNRGAVTTTAVGQNGIYFDMLGDGQSRATGWVTAGEGFLVDLAHGGANVTSGSQFITDMDQLATYDSNGNGVLTGAESATLRVWVPEASGSGNGRAGQLHTLSQLGIASIDLSWTAAGTVDHDNYVDRSFKFTFTDGTTGNGAAVVFEVGDEKTSSTTGATMTQTGLNQLVSAMGSFAVSPVADTSFTRVMSASTPSIVLAAPH
jgi:hypothetical protein